MECNKQELINTVTKSNDEDFRSAKFTYNARNNLKAQI